MTTIRPFTAQDFDQWLPLWDGNNQGQRNQPVTAETWRRILDPDSPVGGLGAFAANGAMAGLLHYILHPVTGHIQPVCYMQDVFVDPAFRRQGIARELVNTLAGMGKTEGWARLYWLAELENKAAQNLYKDIGFRLGFSLHVLPLSPAA
ncbi:MAG: GNAT family N-acetyltransferase [Rhodospirillales bacterium]|nr:GNAT family N-acetyltransferase [Rhodospirillales bacterium]MCB9997309.1 GNAT family N-acetyltransferase [Rhodospirillales bacterium]